MSSFFSKNISVYTIFNDQSFNDMLTNDIFSFEQLGPDHQCLCLIHKSRSMGLAFVVDVSIYAKHWGTFIPLYHTHSFKSILVPLVYKNRCEWQTVQTLIRLHNSRSTLFPHGFLSQYLGLIWKFSLKHV